jgi:hypothetical protein
MPDQWEVHQTPQLYALYVSKNNPDDLMILGGGKYSGSPKRLLSTSVVSVENLLTQPPSDGKPDF